MIEIDCSLRLHSYQLDARFRVPAKGVLGLIGPSGSGKTSLLRAIAGLDMPHSGTIKNGSETWFSSEGTNIPVEQRRVGIVFQDMRLFPHLTVQENLALASKWGNSKPLEADLIEALELTALLQRRPARLSGGEARRVALARALAQNPRLLLLDEPLNGLDPAQRLRILPKLLQAIDIAGIPALFVSHDPDDVAYMCRDFIEISRTNSRNSENTAYRMYEVLPPKPAGPQFEAHWQGDSGGQCVVRIGPTTVPLPKTVKSIEATVGQAVLLQASQTDAFIAEANAICPRDYVSLPLSKSVRGDIEAGAGPLKFPALEIPLSQYDQLARPTLYFRPIAIVPIY